MEEVNGTCLVPFIIVLFFSFFILFFCFKVHDSVFPDFNFYGGVWDFYDCGFFLPTLFILSVCFWTFCAIHACYVLGCLLIFANCRSILLGIVFEEMKYYMHL